MATMISKFRRLITHNKNYDYINNQQSLSENSIPTTETFEKSEAIDINNPNARIEDTDVLCTLASSPLMKAFGSKQTYSRESSKSLECLTSDKHSPLSARESFKKRIKSIIRKQRSFPLEEDRQNASLENIQSTESQQRSSPPIRNSETRIEILEKIRGYQQILGEMFDTEICNEVWNNHIRQYDILIIHAYEDKATAIETENALKNVRPGIQIIRSELPPGTDKIDGWEDMVKSVRQIVVLVSKALDRDLMLRNYLPEIIVTKDTGIVPLYIDENYKHEMPLRYQPLLRNMSMEDIYNDNPRYWAKIIDNKNINSQLYTLRYLRELKKAEYICRIIEENENYFKILHRNCCFHDEY